MYKEHFSDRHNSINFKEEHQMLSLLGYDKMEELISDTIPNEIRLLNELKLDEPLTEIELLSKLKSIGRKNGYYCKRP